MLFPLEKTYTPDENESIYNVWKDCVEYAKVFQKIADLAMRLNRFPGEDVSNAIRVYLGDNVNHSIEKNGIVGDDNSVWVHRTDYFIIEETFTETTTLRTSALLKELEKLIV